MQQDNNNEVYFDSHTHVLDYPQDKMHQYLSNAFNHHVRFISVNATSHQQYASMIELANQYPAYQCTNYSCEEWVSYLQKPIIIPSFGVHPCFIHLQEDNPKWLDLLQQTLQKNKLYGVGQIGLDFRTQTLQKHTKQVQRQYFIKQMQKAFKMNRPVTVHCVRAHGDLLKILKDYNKNFEIKAKESKKQQEKITKNKIVTPIIMHSYGGSKQITKSLLKLNHLNIYFSLSLKRSEQLCSVIPIDRLLLETDAPYQLNLPLLIQQKIVNQGEIQEGELANRVEYVSANVPSLCKEYGMGRLAFSRKVLQNALRVFKLIL